MSMFGFLKRLFSSKHSSKNIKVLESVFDIDISDSTEYDRALIHKSSTLDENNERLEFLGDAVLDLSVAHHLFLEYPDMAEGSLTKLKSKLVNRDRLSALAIKMGLCDALHLKKQKDLRPELIMGNVLEAVFGAMYLEQGFEVTREKIITQIESHVVIDELLEELVDPKSRLLELAQRMHWEIKFRVRGEPKDSEFLFSAEVMKEGKCLGNGKGQSKKKAEKEAARSALSRIEE